MEKGTKKLKSVMLRIGWLVALAFYLAAASLTIYQWFVPDHKILLCFNLFNEALPEFIVAVLSVPCVLYFFKKVNELINNQ